MDIPNQGFHKHYFGFAIFDLLATIVVAFILTYMLKKHTKYSFSLVFSSLLLFFVLLGEYFHRKLNIV